MLQAGLSAKLWDNAITDTPTGRSGVARWQVNILKLKTIVISLAIRLCRLSRGKSDACMCEDMERFIVFRFCPKSRILPRYTDYTINEIPVILDN